MFSAKKRLAVKASVIGGTDRYKVLSSTGSNMGGGSGGGSTLVSNPGIGNQMDGMLRGIVPDNNEAMLRKYYRDIYSYDSVAGAAVDLMSTLPFSDWTLMGADEKELEPFRVATDMLSLKSIMPELSIDYLVLGSFTGSIIYKKDTKNFTDLIPHDPDNLEFKKSPLYSSDPLITLKVPKEYREFAQSTHPYFQRLQGRLPQSMLDALRSSSVTLDSLTTLYIPRRTFTNSTGTSIFKRVLPLYLLERILYRGTLTEAGRRQRSTLHIMAGNEDWEPTEEELKNLVGLFQQADLDPVGAIVATRNDIQTSDIRSAGDFWKFTDVIDTTTNMKLKALGISEGFLSGDVNFSCVTGDTLVPTEKGLLRIDEIGELGSSIPGSTKYKAIDLVVGSRTKPRTARTWMNNGVAPTLVIKTAQGNEFSGTPKHPMLVLKDGKLSKVAASDVKVGDFFCINLEPQVRTSTLDLDLILKEPLQVVGQGSRPLKHINKPTRMTPELAYSLGCLVSEGYINTSSHGRTKAVRFGNTDPAFIESYKAKMRSAFGDNLVFTDSTTAHGRRGLFQEFPNGATVQVCNLKPFTTTIATSKMLCSYLEQLGVLADGHTKGQRSSYYKEVPWSVLQADVDCWYAFLAAYLEGDGYITKKTGEMGFASYSDRLLSQLLAMFNALGVIARKAGNKVTLNAQDASKVWPKLKPYMVTKDYDLHHKVCRPRLTYGVPAQPIFDLLDSRYVRRAQLGTVYLNDEGSEVLVSNQVLKRALPKKQTTKSFILYDLYDKGTYDEALAEIEKISPKAHARVLKLLATRYVFTPVVSIEVGKKQLVYDLSMNDTLESLTTGKTSYQNPYFIVNGMVGGNTAEVSLSVFIEHIRSYREMLTRRIFYDKLFPLVAVINGLYRKDQQQQEIKEQVERKIEQSYLRNRNREYAVDNASGPDVNENYINERMIVDKQINNTTKLLIPQIQWHKQLRPQADQEYLNVLQTLTEHGVPITLRMWAASGGLTLENIINELDEDGVHQQTIKELKERYGPAKGSGGDDDDGGGYEESSLTGGGIKRKGLLGRDYGAASEAVGTSKTGKPKAIYNQKGAHEKVNREIAKAMQNLSDPQTFDKRRAETRLKAQTQTNPYGRT